MLYKCKCTTNYEILKRTLWKPRRVHIVQLITWLPINIMPNIGEYDEKNCYYSASAFADSITEHAKEWCVIFLMYFIGVKEREKSKGQMNIVRNFIFLLVFLFSINVSQIFIHEYKYDFICIRLKYIS